MNIYHPLTKLLLSNKMKISSKHTWLPPKMQDSGMVAPARPLRLDTTGGVATTIQRSRGWGIACPTSKNYM